MNQKWSIVTSKVFICIKILQSNFLNSIDILIFSRGLYFNGTFLFCIAPLIIEFVNFLNIHKMGWIVKKWSTIPIFVSKFYIIKFSRAFLAIKSSFKDHCLYAYSYFCGLKHSKSHCFSCQLTKINFWAPMQKYVSLIL